MDLADAPSLNDAMDKKLTQGGWAACLFLLNYVAVFALGNSGAVSIEVAFGMLVVLVLITYKFANAPIDSE